MCYVYFTYFIFISSVIFYEYAVVNLFYISNCKIENLFDFSQHSCFGFQINTYCTIPKPNVSRVSISLLFDSVYTCWDFATFVFLTWSGLWTVRTSTIRSIQLYRVYILNTKELLFRPIWTYRYCREQCIT